MSLWDRLAKAAAASSMGNSNNDEDDWERISTMLREKVQPASQDSPVVTAMVGYRHPWMFDGDQDPLFSMLTATTAISFEWMWTPETAMAFSLFMVVLALFLCCWMSHKIGEVLCTTMTGIVAMSLMIGVLLIFVSQWW